MRQVVAYTMDLTGDATRAGVLRAVGVHGPVSRTALATQLGVSAATITAVTKELLEVGLLETVGKLPTDGRGRPAELLGLVASSAHTIGAKVTDTRVIGIVSDLGGNLVTKFTEPFDPRSDDPSTALEEVLRRHIGDGPGALLGIGLGVPGMVDDADGGTVFAPTLGWDGLPIAAELQRRLDLPVLVENDVHTLAVAESLYGHGRQVDDYLTITIGRGVGLGIVIGGQLHRGAHGGAAELGHTQAVADGPVCDCGRRGCLEAVAAEPALVRIAADQGLLDGEASIEDLRALARSGSVAARSVFRDAGRHLGRSVATLVTLLGPELVIVSGEGTASWDLLSSGFDEAYEAGRLAFHADVEVVVDHWDDLDWARGAASLLTRSVFAPSASGNSVERWVRSRLATGGRLEVAGDGR